MNSTALNSMMTRIRALPAVLTALVLAFSLAGCDSTSNDNDEVRPFDLEVKVTYPEGYSEPVSEGATVEMTNRTRDTTLTAVTNENGVAVFEKLSPGPYDLSASRELAPSEAATVTETRRASVDLSATLPTQTLEGPSDSPLEVQLGKTGVGTFVFSEVYYTGSELPNGDTYFRDQFFELYNNTDETLEADNLYIGVVHGASGQINPGTEPTPFPTDEAAYVESVWQVPDDNVTVDPGETLVIAQHGINHSGDPNGNPDSPVDLSDADFEMYTGNDEDTDVNGVPNMKRVYFNGGFYSLVPVFGPALVLFRTDNFEALERKPVPGVSFYNDRIRVPNDLIIDSFEALQGPNSGDYMRIPLDVNAGFVSAGDTYTSESAERLIDTEVNGRPVLKNTNNTGNDFEITDTPTPGTVK